MRLVGLVRWILDEVTETKNAKGTRGPMCLVLGNLFQLLRSRNGLLLEQFAESVNCRSYHYDLNASSYPYGSFRL